MVEKISVIVPVYNAGRQIGKLVKQLITQPYDNLEILLVDDGSVDDSLDICKELARQDDRICVLEKENGGVSSARNLGIESATGSYIYFADADDGIEPEIFVRFASLVTQNRDADLFVGDFSTNGQFMYHGTFLGRYSTNDVLEDLVEHFATYYYGAVWNKLYRLSLIKQLLIRFPDQIQWAEDIIFNLSYLQWCQTIVFTNEKVYIYQFHEGCGLGSTKGGHTPKEVLKIRKMRYEGLQQLLQSAHVARPLYGQAQMWFLEDVNSYLTVLLEQENTKQQKRQIFFLLVKDDELTEFAQSMEVNVRCVKLLILQKGLAHKQYELLYIFYCAKRQLRKNRKLAKGVCRLSGAPRILY